MSRRAWLGLPKHSDITDLNNQKFSQQAEKYAKSIKTNSLKTKISKSECLFGLVCSERKTESKHQIVQTFTNLKSYRYPKVMLINTNTTKKYRKYSQFAKV